VHHVVATAGGVVQCGAVWCNVLQRVAACCSVLQCWSTMHHVVVTAGADATWWIAVCCDVLQCVAVYCSVLQCVAVCCSVSQCIAVGCSV